MPDHNQDLSPSELRQYFRDFFSFTAHCIRSFLASAREHYRVLLLILLLAGTGIFFVLKSRPDEYEYRMSCVYNDNQAKTFGELLAQLDFLLAHDEYNILSAQLHLPEDQLRKIVSIKGKTMTLGVLEHDFSGNKAPFFIDVKVRDASVIRELESVLLDYLNHNDLSVRSVEQQMNKWKSRDTFYTQQLSKLDSLKEVIRQSYLNTNNDIDLAQKENSVVDIYRLSDSMSFYLADVRYYLNHYQTVQKIYGFKLISIHAHSSVVKKTILYSMIVCIAAWFFLAFKDLVYGTDKAARYSGDKS